MGVNDFAGSILSQIDDWRQKAFLLACINPLAFYVVMGCTLPTYLERIDALEKLWKQIRDEALKNDSFN